MSTTLFYGLILAAGNIALTVIDYLLGHQTDKINEASWISIGVFILSILVLWLGIRAKRDAQPSQTLPYKQGALTGLTIAGIGTLITAAYVYIHFAVINPGYPDHIVAAALQRATAAKMPAAEFAGIEQSIRAQFTPVKLAISTLGTGVINGLIVSLITAAFMRQNPTVAAAQK